MTAVRKNLLWLLVSQTATWVVSFVLLVVTPSLLPTEAFGTLAFASAFVQYFSLAAGLETAQLLTKEIAREPGLVGPYVRNGLTLKVVVVGLLSAIALCVAVLARMNSLTTQLIALGCVGMMLGNLNSVLQGALAGLHRVARAAMWAVVQLYAGAALGIAALLLGGGVVAFAGVVALATAIPLVANFATVRPYLHGSWRPDVATWRRLVGRGLPLLTLSGLILFYSTIDIVILNWLAGPVAVGWYALAYRWAGIPMFISTAVVGAFFPVFSQHGRSQGPAFAEAVNRALLIVVLVSAPAAFGLAAIADDVIRTLAPPEYAEAAPVLRLLVLQIPIAAVDTILGTALVASDRVRQYLWIPAGAAVLTPIVLILTLRDRSIESAVIVAAVVTTATEIYVFVGAWRLRAHGVLDRATVSRCGRAVVAAAMIVPALWPLANVSLLLRIPIASAVYVLAALGLRVVTIAEIAATRNNLRSMFQRPGNAESDAPTQL